jgi:hypothetical protein
MAFESAEWKRRLSEILNEHPDIGKATGMLEVNLNEGVIANVYLNKKIRSASESVAWFDHLKEKVESVNVHVIIG